MKDSVIEMKKCGEVNFDSDSFDVEKIVEPGPLYENSGLHSGNTLEILKS